MKRTIALLLSVMLALGALSSGAAAETSSDEPAQPVEVLQEKESVIYFDTRGTDWKDFSVIFCHIWEYSGDSFFEWQTKRERCTSEGDGLWSYRLSDYGISLENGKTYGVMFSSIEGDETYPLLMDSSCYEDTA